MTTRWGTKIALIVAITTTILLFSISILVSNLGFKASPARLSAYFAPQSSVIQPNKKTIQYLTIQTDRPTYLASFEAEILYDPVQLSFDSLVAQDGWRIFKQQSNPGVVSVVLVPTEERGKLTEISGGVAVAGISFLALKEGQSIVRINPDRLISVVADAANDPSIYSASLAIQEALIVVSSSRPVSSITTPPPSLGEDETTGGQKIFSQNVIAGYSSAAIISTLRYPARIEVEFGLTPQLGSTILTNEITPQAVVHLSGLSESTHYYYRLKAIGQTSKIVSSMRSFITSKKSKENLVDYDKSELLISRSPAKSTTNAFIVLRDKEGNIVEADPALTVLKGIATITHPVNFGGIKVVVVESKVTTKQTVEVSLHGGKQDSPTQKIQFDPNFYEPVEPIDGRAIAIDWGHKTISLVILLIGILVISGVLLSKLIRSQ